MFNTDQAHIGEYARASAENTARVVEFVLTSIQRHFQYVKPIMLREKTVAKMPNIQKGIDWAYEHADKLYAACFTPGLTSAERLILLTACPGLGLPKAGFVLQLCTGAVGCMDVHNLRRFGLKASTFSTSSKTSAQLLHKKAQLYVDTCERMGGSAYLWDSWCQLIADKYPRVWRDAEHVSNEHANCFV